MSFIKEHPIAASAVALVVISNSIKGGIGLYELQPDLANLVSSALLSGGTELMLWFATAQWAKHRVVSGKVITSRAGWTAVVAVCSTALNWTFFQTRIEQAVAAVVLAAVGPVVSLVAGMITGEAEGAQAQAEASTTARQHEIDLLDRELERERQKRLTLNAQARLAKAQASAREPEQVTEQPPTPAQEMSAMSAGEVREKMIALWGEDPTRSLRDLAEMLPRSYTAIRGYKDDLVENGYVTIRDGAYHPNGK